ncbi:helix-turn-helix transcriptional regulator [Paraburkholderia solisilvae]|uniref:HTH-type transcriptional activator RhaS n=1 Tax=Paraburkholderia solisilvae TaxID=624376 RepID=A0A6J5E060_9BURK|nr:AraC family transcriptional regulator [Paraburkholderia solisilvae]CAB3759084.1 HTH-type transcriptional activator RhaS [Paraburkholderia solisilvae]
MTKASEIIATPPMRPMWHGITSYDPGLWAMLTAECGSRARFDISREAHCGMEHEQAGEIAVRNVEMGWQAMERGMGLAKSHVERHITVLAVQRGTLVIEDRYQTLSLKTGDMVMLDDALSHTLHFNHPALCSTVQIPPRVLTDRGIPVRFSSGCQPVHANPEVTAVRDLFLTFCAHAGSAGNALRERVGLQFLDLMDIVMKSSDASHSGRSTEGMLLRAKQIVARRFGDPNLSLSEIADELHVSSSSLFRAFRDRGMSPMRFAYSLRLEHAKNMLSGTSHVSIQEVAAHCGFTSLAHFSRSFKKEHGMAPRDYAAQQRSVAADAATDPDAEM